MSEPPSPPPSRWMSRTFHIVLISCLLAVVAYRVCGYFIRSNAGLGDDGTTWTQLDVRELRESAFEAFRQDDWAAAATAFGELAERDPGNWQMRRYLAYSLAQAEQYDESLAEFLALANYDSRARGWALLHVAKIYAVKHENQLALDYLGEAVAEGYRIRRARSLMDDPAFRNLREDADFQRLAERILQPEDRDHFRRFDFLLGQWRLIQENDVQSGTLEMTQTPDGFAMLGSWIQLSDSSRTTIFAFYDHPSSAWRQTWVGPRGSVIDLREELDEAEVSLFRGRLTTGGETQQLARLVLSPDETGLYRIRLEVSQDDGKTWVARLNARLVPTDPPVTESPESTRH